MNEVDPTNKQKRKTVVIRIISIVSTLCILGGTWLWNEHASHKAEVQEVEKPNFSEVIQIGDLMTLKCYYHNVAEYEKQPDGLLRYGLFQVGYKKFWIEYTGTVKIGIDVNKVKIGEPDEAGVIKVYIPEVDKFEANQDSNSVKEPIYEKGVFTSITVEEKTAALAKAQDDMEVAAKDDKAMISRAKENAQSIIKQYIINVGMALGQEYTVQWVDTPDEVDYVEKGGTEDGK